MIRRVFPCPAIFGTLSVAHNGESCEVVAATPSYPACETSFTTADQGAVALAICAVRLGEETGDTKALRLLGEYLDRHWYEMASPVLLYAIRTAGY